MTTKQQKESPDLSVRFREITLANPIMTASGTCGYAFELRDFVDMSQLGGFVTKSITLRPRAGNPPQRTYETAAGMLNSIGLANVGLDRFLEEKMPLLERMPMPVFVNVAGKTIDEYVEVVHVLSKYDTIQGLELNISCPNVKHGGLTFGTDPRAIVELVGAVKEKCAGKLLIVKLTPNVTDIVVNARAAIEAGADVLSLVNTFVGLAISAEKRKPILGNVYGGLSGPAIKPLALNLVHKVYQEAAREMKVPVIGLGGIHNATDALEFIIAGASAVAVGTQMMVHPQCIMEIIDGIRDYLIRHEFASVGELVGTLD